MNPILHCSDKFSVLDIAVSHLPGLVLLIEWSTAHCNLAAYFTPGASSGCSEES